MATGGTDAGAGGSDAGRGGTGTAAKGGTDVGGSTGGTDPSAGSGNPTGGAPDAGAPSGGKGGKGGAGGTSGSGVGGSGLSSGTGGEGGDLGGAGTQAGEGGTAGEPAVGGSSGAGAGGTAGGGMGGTAGSMAGTSGAGMAGSGGQPPVTCSSDADCAATTEYCKKTSCDAATGACTPRATSCTGNDATFAPVCGCDKFTYYTACVAAREGVNVAASGECGTGSPCTRTGGSGDSCVPKRAHAACYRERSNCSGTAPNEGVCWVLPETCPQEEAAHLYCNQGGTPECHGLCEALVSKFPLVMNSNQCN